MPTIKVVNKKKHQETSNDVYIGRPSKWGNPFSHLPNSIAKYKVTSREESILKYEQWIKTQPHLMNSLPELKGKILVCWCKPLSCHGDILKKLVENKDE